MVMILLLFNLFEIGINGSYIFSFSMKTFSFKDSWKFWKRSDRVVQQLSALATKPVDPETHTVEGKNHLPYVCSGACTNTYNV